jgi:EmrB/QacA subfamily drug resistance transporter
VESFPSQPESQGFVAPSGTPQRLRGWSLASVLIGLMLTLLLAALDQTIVGTALPKIISELQGADLYIWPTTAYLLASTTMIPIVGKLSDQFGRKWFLVAGVLVFLLGSALSGASQTMFQLIAFRAFQGLGGGVLLSLVFTLVGDIFSPAERARWQGLFTAVFAIASVIGPAVGGTITDHFTWRWVFYVNLPIGALALAALVIWLPANISVRSTRVTGWAAVRRIDFLGAVTAAAATICLLLGLTWGGNHTYDWASPQVLGTLAAAVALFVAFFFAERYALEPILPLDLFRNQVFAVGALLALAVGMALFAVVIYLPLFIQGVLGQTATNSGAVVTPLTLTMAAGAAIVGQIVSRVGRYQFAAIVGSLVLLGGVFLLTRMTISTGLPEVTRDMIVIGLGLGMIQPVMTLAVQNAIPRSRLGVGTGAVTYLRSTGSTLGVAVVGAVEYNAYVNELARRFPAAAKPFAAQLAPDKLQQILLSPSLSHLVQARATQQAVQQAVPRAVSQEVPQIVHQAVQQALAKALPPAIAQATANVPPGPQHAQQVAAITQQVTAQVTAQVTQQVTAQVTPTATAQVTAQVTHQVTLQIATIFNQLMDATRHALAVGIQQGFWVGMLVCVGVLVLALFLKDVPLQRRESPAMAPARAGATPPAPAAGEQGEREAAPQGV